MFIKRSMQRVGYNFALGSSLCGPGFQNTKPVAASVKTKCIELVFIDWHCWGLERVEKKERLGLGFRKSWKTWNEYFGEMFENFEIENFEVRCLKNTTLSEMHIISRAIAGKSRKVQVVNRDINLQGTRVRGWQLTCSGPAGHTPLCPPPQSTTIVDQLVYRDAYPPPL